MLHRTDSEKGSARLAPPLPAHPQTANARGKVAENTTLPLRQPATAVRQAPVFTAAPNMIFRILQPKNTMSIAERFMLLPPAIDYAGFTFRLQFTEHSQYGIGIAFILTGCHSRKKYKRLAWKQGYWEDKSSQRQISTMFSNYLFYEPLFDTSDTSLSQALQNLHQRLIDYKLLHPAVYRRAFDTGNLICSPIKLLEE